MWQLHWCGRCSKPAETRPAEPRLGAALDILLAYGLLFKASQSRVFVLRPRDALTGQSLRSALLLAFLGVVAQEDGTRSAHQLETVGVQPCQAHPKPIRSPSERIDNMLEGLLVKSKVLGRGNDGSSSPEVCNPRPKESYELAQASKSSTPWVTTMSLSLGRGSESQLRLRGMFPLMLTVLNRDYSRRYCTIESLLRAVSIRGTIASRTSPEMGSVRMIPEIAETAPSLPNLLGTGRAEAHLLALRRRSREIKLG